MFTQCRGCGEIFKVAVDDLATASAMVRCSSCGTVFNALDTLSDYKPQESADLILHEHDNPPPLLTHEFKQSIIQENIKKPVEASSKEDAEKIDFDISNQEVDEEQDEIEQFDEEHDEEIVYALKPDFVEDNNISTRKKSSALWFLSFLILLSGLLWQMVNALKNGNIELPEGPFKQAVCAEIGCFSATKKSNFNSIALVSRSIRQHPGRDNALIITTGIINSDEKTQNFPALQIKMSNLNGEVVAMRRFLPHEYLDSESIKMGLIPNTLIPITLELQSPGKSAVTFEVGFSPTFGEI